MSSSEFQSGRSIRCNGDLISRLRKRAGWTQSELAFRTGFTERLIVKAEASQNVAAATLQIIAQALNEAGIDVTFQDLSADPTVLAKAFFRSICQFGHLSSELNANLLTDDLIVQFSGDPKVFSFAGKHVGIDAARNAFAKFFEAIQPFDHRHEIEQVQFLGTRDGNQGDHGVLVWGETLANIAGAIDSRPLKFAIRMNFKDARLTAFDYQFDTLEFAKRLGDLKV